jgi:hypothetical protein
MYFVQYNMHILLEKVLNFERLLYVTYEKWSTIFLIARCWIANLALQIITEDWKNSLCIIVMQYV